VGSCLHVKKARSIDEYLEGVPGGQRDVLEKLRRQIMEAAPGAVEVISYGIPFFKFKGEYVAGFAAYKSHCSFALWEGKWQRLVSAKVVSTKELEGYETTTGTIQFTPERPLPASLVRKLVKARVREIEVKAKVKK